jgi:alpha-L-fucosidase
MTPRPKTEVLGWLIPCIGRDGSLLLGVGPRADGTHDPSHAQALEEIGAWMKDNGEAIYGTRGGPWKPSANYVATRKGDKVYLFVTKWRGDDLSLPPLPTEVKSVRLLSPSGSASLTTTADKWTLSVPERFHRQPATIVEITLDRAALRLPAVAPFPPPVNLALGKPVTATSVWPGRDRTDLKPSSITDGNPTTLWGADDKTASASVTVDLEQEREVGSTRLSDAPHGRTRAFDLEAQINGQWKTIASGERIGSDSELSFKPVKARLFRLNLRKTDGTPTLAEFQLFGQPQ